MALHHLAAKAAASASRLQGVVGSPPHRGRISSSKSKFVQHPVRIARQWQQSFQKAFFWGMNLRMTANCARCGRVLTSEQGLIHGIGSGCIRKVSAFERAEMQGQMRLMGVF